jgi:glycosyltransferase involved in cell wall biosynthesis
MNRNSCCQPLTIFCNMPITKIPSRSGRPSLRDYPIVVESHLRWDFVWQRPQQLLSRMARKSPILFIEEPLYLDDICENDIDLSSPLDNVYRMIPRLTSDLRNHYDSSIEEVKKLVTAELSSGGRLEGQFANCIHWFYTPMPAATMLGAFNEIGVVYDCMDELSQFRNAPPELRARENLLMSNADVVFTGGHKLYKSKSATHPNVHFFGCGVDADHFGKARLNATPLATDVPSRGPVAGYFGVIDERLDYDLIDSLAARYPECSVVMVGPTAKVDPAELPTRQNIHWLGQRSYDDLPKYLKTFDVCLMPFALNEATEYINPTKTLEYMAAGKPIVSTAVPDVITNFTPIVKVARSADAFIDAVISASAEPDASAIEAGIEMAASSTWERIVARMRALIHEAVDELPIPASIAASGPLANREIAELPGA